MSFLIKVALLFALVIFCIPVDPQEMSRNGTSSRMVGIFDYFGLAQAAYNDASGFCARNPAACDTGASVGDLFMAKARTGLRMVEGFVGASDKPVEAAKAQPKAAPVEATGSVAGLAVPLPPKKPALPQRVAQASGQSS